MSKDRFDACPGCKNRSFFGNTAVFKCPKCFRFFCPKCIGFSFWSGYKCPGCKYHLKPKELPKLRVGSC